MINVNQITSQLAKMPDQALQQYAAMHKSDPYTMALALAESNRRKQMRSGAHMQQGEQPKVVDQELANMSALPEDTGIAQLPADNIQGMAGGGIVAFEEGGYVPRYGGFTDGSVVSDPMGAIAFRDSGGQTADDRTIMERLGIFNPENRRALERANNKTIVPAPVAPAVDQTLAENARLAGQNRGAAGVPIGGIDALVDSPAAKAEAAKAEAAKAAGPGVSAPNVASYEKRYMDMLGKGEVSKEDRMKEMTDVNKPVLEKMASVIESNKNKLKTEGEQNFYMSLIVGGAEAAAGDSKYALQNIAKGVAKGGAQYGEGLKDLRKAAQENTKMELSMAEYEASGKKDALKAYYDHQDKMQGYKAQGLASLYGHEISGQYSLAAAGTHAAATKSHLGAQERLIERIGSDPKFAAAYNTYLTAGADAKALPTIAAGYAKDPMKLEMLKQTDPALYNSVKAYLGQQTVPQAMSTPTGQARS